MSGIPLGDQLRRFADSRVDDIDPADVRQLVIFADIVDACIQSRDEAIANLSARLDTAYDAACRIEQHLTKWGR